MGQLTTLVTGGAGFIGSHLCERLMERGDRVVALDNLDTFYPATCKRRNLSGIAEHERFTLLEEDIRNGEAVARILKKCRVDRIAHLAARAGVRPSLDGPAQYFDVNATGTVSVLDAAQRAGVRDVVLASSSSVYGTGALPPFQEDSAKLEPISPYAASKRAMEVAAETYARLYDLNVTCLRFFTVYGPRQRPDMAIAKFVRRVCHGKPIDMYGDGSSCRDYTFVLDAVRGLIAALDRVEALDVHLINIGSGQPVGLRTLISEVGRAAGREPVVDQRPAQPGDPDITHASIDRARRLLDYAPQVRLREGLERYMEWAQRADDDRLAVQVLD